MSRPSRRLVVACVWGALAIGGPFLTPDCPSAHAEESSSRPARQRIAPRDPSARRPTGAPETSGSWWIGTAAVALTLALFGGISLASRRFPPLRDSGPLQVVGRAGLSPKHTVYLLRVGERVLIVGAGAQGPPALLGELTDPAELHRLAPRPRHAPVASSVDTRIGDNL